MSLLRDSSIAFDNVAAACHSGIRTHCTRCLSCEIAGVATRPGFEDREPKFESVHLLDATHRSCTNTFSSA